MEPKGQVVKAMAVIQRPRDGALLVSEGANPAGELFDRPLGGHVEFGEHARDTVRREFREEIGQALTGVRLAGVLENIFQWAVPPSMRSCSSSPPPSPMRLPTRYPSRPFWRL